MNEAVRTVDGLVEEEEGSAREHDLLKKDVLPLGGMD